MKKDEFITRVAEKHGLSKKKAGEIVNGVFDEISNVLKNDDKITFLNFGTFKVSHRAARTARNPRTKAIIQVPARKVPAFKAGKSLKDKLN